MSLDSSGQVARLRHGRFACVLLALPALHWTPYVWPFCVRQQLRRLLPLYLLSCHVTVGSELMQVDPETNEIAGVFESIQPSDTDLGSKAPKDVKITGLWYGQLS